MANPAIWLRDGHKFVDKGIEFAVALTDDGKINYWAYRPSMMTFEDAAKRLEADIAKRGQKIVNRE